MAEKDLPEDQKIRIIPLSEVTDEQFERWKKDEFERIATLTNRIISKD